MSYKRLHSLSILIIIALLALALVGCGGTTTTLQPTETTAAAAASTRADYYVSVADLAGGVDDYFVIDARDAESYQAGHIEGAINVPWQTFSDMEGKAGDPDWGTLLPAEDIGRNLGELGVDVSKTIVVYADPNGWGEDGRVVWSLLSVGLENARMLDGGWPAWKASDGQTSTEAVKLPVTTVEVASSLDADLNITTEELSSNLDNLVVIDARNTKEYEGATDYGEARGGHIPGANNIPFPTLFSDEGTLKSDADLEALFADAGIEKDDQIAVYCTKGIRSGYMTLVLRMLGYSGARNYDASFYSWAGDSTLPVEK